MSSIEFVKDNSYSPPLYWALRDHFEVGNVHHLHHRVYEADWAYPAANVRIAVGSLKECQAALIACAARMDAASTDQSANTEVTEDVHGEYDHTTVSYAFGRRQVIASTRSECTRCGSGRAVM